MWSLFLFRQTIIREIYTQYYERREDSFASLLFLFLCQTNSRAVRTSELVRQIYIRKERKYMGMIKAKKVSEEKRCKNCKGTGMVQIRTGVRGIGKIQKEDEK